MRIKLSVIYVFIVFSTAVWIWNETITMRLRCVFLLRCVCYTIHRRSWHLDWVNNIKNVLLSFLNGVVPFQETKRNRANSENVNKTLTFWTNINHRASPQDLAIFFNLLSTFKYSWVWGTYRPWYKSFKHFSMPPL